MLNDLFRTYKKIILVFLILLCAVFFWYYGCRDTGRSEEEIVKWEKVSGEKSAGYHYYFRTKNFNGTVIFGDGTGISEEKEIPVVMEISCPKKAFAGVMRLTLPGENGKGISWQSAVKCKKGGKSETVLNVPQLGNPSAVCFEILDSFGAVQLSENVSFSSESQGRGKEEKSSYSETRLWYIKKALYAFQNSQLPNTFYYGSFFILYVLLIAFIAYYYLSRVKKREYIWLVVPLLSIAFTVSLFIRTRGMAGGEEGSFFAVRIVDTQKVEESIYFLRQSEETENRSINLLPSITSVTPLDYRYSIHENKNENVKPAEADFTVNDTNHGFEIDFGESVPGSSTLLKLCRRTGDSPLSSSFSQNIKTTLSAFGGQITNLSDTGFSRVMVIRGNQYCILKDVKAGATVSVNKKNVKCWSRYDTNNADTTEKKNTVTGNLMRYIHQTYMSDAQMHNELLIIGITGENNFQIFADKNNLKKHVTLVVNHFRLRDTGQHYSLLDINYSCLKESGSSETLREGILEKSRTEAVYVPGAKEQIWALVRNRDKYKGKIFAYNTQTQKQEEILDSPDDCLYREELAPYLSSNQELILTYELEDGTAYSEAPVLSLYYMER